jgi:hypothetical protein
MANMAMATFTSSRAEEGFESKIFKHLRREAAEERGVSGNHHVSPSGLLLPRFGVFDVKIDDDEPERRDPLASLGFNQAPQVSVLKYEWRQFLG